MTRRALVILILLAILLLAAHLWPSPAASDQPVAASRIPASEFVAIRSAVAAEAPGDTRETEDVRPSALPQPRTLSPTPVPAQRASAIPVGALGSSPAPVRTPAPGGAVKAASVAGSLAGRSPTASASPSTEDWTARPGTISGVASWFASPIGVSAAGPALRAAIGPGWRGRQVSVCAGQRCVSTILGDWCLCGDRHGVPTVIDLDVAAFRQLAQLSIGVIAVEVTW